jgi:hypothetical protein
MKSSTRSSASCLMARSTRGDRAPLVDSVSFLSPTYASIGHILNKAADISFILQYQFLSINNMRYYDGISCSQNIYLFGFPSRGNMMIGSNDMCPII